MIKFIRALRDFLQNFWVLVGTLDYLQKAIQRHETQQAELLDKFDKLIEVDRQFVSTLATFLSQQDILIKEKLKAELLTKPNPHDARY